MASIGAVSEKPGLVSLGLPVDYVAAWYDACATFVDLAPWHRILERQAIQIDATSSLSLSSKSNASVHLALSDKSTAKYYNRYKVAQSMFPSLVIQKILLKIH